MHVLRPEGIMKSDFFSFLSPEDQDAILSYSVQGHR